MKVCVVINLPEYDRSAISYFRKYYYGRFKNILFTCPWPDECIVEPDVVSTHYFYSYWYASAAEAVKLLDKKYDYYVFTNENIVLSPEINESDFHSRINRFGRAEVAISTPNPLFAPYGFRWSKAKYMIYPFIYSAAEWSVLLAPFNEALLKMVKYFGSYDKYISDSFFGRLADSEAGEDEIKFKRILGGLCKIPYPLAYSHSDFIVVPRRNIDRVIEQALALAAVGVHCDAAIPTFSILMFEKGGICTLEPYDIAKELLDFDLKEVGSIAKKLGDGIFVRIPIKKLLESGK